jgi:homoserine O-acetyltransferase
MNLDPLDWIYQSYAYDAHDVAGEARFGGRLGAALTTIARARSSSLPTAIFTILPTPRAMLHS